MATQYLQTLLDPFRHGPVHMGWGCLVPTSCQTAYLRTSITSNADGSALVFALPSAKGLLQYSVGGAAVAGLSTLDAVDINTIASNFSQGRVVSLGIKAIPMVAATAIPGTCVTGMIPNTTFSLLNSMTPNDLVSFSSSHISRGVDGGVATGRPVDPISFAFWQQETNAVGWQTTTLIPFGVPYVAFTGLPTSSSITVELAFNFEALAIQAHGVGAMLSEGQVSDKMSDYWATAEQFYSRMAPYLPSPGKQLEGTDGSMLASKILAGAGAGLLSYGYEQARRRNR
jgi:hypothetical protein